MDYHLSSSNINGLVEERVSWFGWDSWLAGVVSVGFLVLFRVCCLVLAGYILAV